MSEQTCHAVLCSDHEPTSNNVSNVSNNVLGVFGCYHKKALNIPHCQPIWNYKNSKGKFSFRSSSWTSRAVGWILSLDAGSGTWCRESAGVGPSSSRRTTWKRRTCSGTAWRSWLRGGSCAQALRFSSKRNSVGMAFGKLRSQVESGVDYSVWDIKVHIHVHLT